MGLNVSRKDGPDAAYQTTRIQSEGLVEFHVAVHPQGSGSFEEQARTGYATLLQALERDGLSPADLVIEKIYFSDIGRQFDALELVRSETYSLLGISPDSRPAATFLQQPPCEPGRLIEFQALALAGPATASPTWRPIPGLPGLASGKVIVHDGLRHVCLHNITGAGEGGVPFLDQSRQMFERAKACLERGDVSFHDVVRTWIYVSDIERDYDDFNRVRSAFYEGLGLRRIPASTGIQGGTYPPHAGCSMDVYALEPSSDASVTTMHAKTMSEAPSYGSTFSRGMAVKTDNRTTAFVSGTASIDASGNVMHVGDLRAQLNRVLDNVEALLDSSGGRLSDVVSATTYLKSSDSLPAFLDTWVARGLPADIPNTVTKADVCRPEWLCEIEAIAVF